MCPCPTAAPGDGGNIATLDDAVAAFNPTKRVSGKTIIRVRPC
jgi:hypothetical protein